MKNFNKIVIFILLTSQIYYAQGFAVEKNFTVNDGLSQNFIFSIIQDRKGYLWIGTQDGLNRFDGFEFTVYKNDPRNKYSLTGNFVKSLLEDDEDNLWIGTGNGLSKLDLKTGQFTQPYFPKQLIDTLNNQHVTSLLFDNEKRLWIGTRNGLLLFDPGKNLLINLAKYSNLIELADKYIFTIFQDRDFNIWIGTYGDGLFRFDLKEKKLQKVMIPKINVTAVFSIAQISASELLFGTYEIGLIRYNLKSNSFEWLDPQKYNYKSLVYNVVPYSEDCAFVETQSGVYRYDTVKNEFELVWSQEDKSYPRSMIIDRSKNLWIGTAGQGLLNIPLERKNFITIKQIHNKNKNGLSFNSVRAFFVDKENNLWIGGHSTINRVALNKLRNSNFEKISEFDGLNVYSILQDPNRPNIFWVSTEGDGIIKYNSSNRLLLRKFNVSKSIKFFTEAYTSILASNGKIYFGTDQSLVVYDPQNEKFFEFIHTKKNNISIVDRKIKALYEDKKGNLWIGSDRDGLSILNINTNSITSYRSENFTGSLSSNRVNCFCEDKNGIMWIGTENGLNKFIPGENRFINYTVKDGFSNDFIYGILNDNENNLWLSTNRGIIKFSPQKKAVVNYDVTYGLQSNEFNTCAFYKNSAGMMFFGGINGFTYFYPEQIKFSSYQPDVVVSKFKKNNKCFDLGKNISYLKSIELNYDDLFFSFDFFSTDFTHPTRIKYRYMLQGFDDRWIDTDYRSRTANLTNIEPGEYILRIGATNADGIWSDKEANIKLIIHPAYYNTWWFRSFIALIIFSVGFFLYKTRVNILKHEKEIQRDLTSKLLNSQEDERRNISKELHDDLGQNLLVVKNKLLLSKHKNDLSNNVDDVLHILDNSIQDISNISHLLHPSELETLGLTQSIESMIDRLASSSDLKIINKLDNIDKFFEAKERINIYRIIQESLNNVLKHSKAANVVLSSIVKKNKLVLSIKDDGLGFDTSISQSKSTKPHLGLKSMNERAFMLNGELSINSSVNKGTEIIIVFNNRTGRI